ncbi:unnamed protein product, partial [Amoebophrya sp. A120]
EKLTNIRVNQSRVRIWWLEFGYHRTLRVNLFLLQKLTLSLWRKETVRDSKIVKSFQERWSYFNYFSNFLEFLWNGILDKRNRARIHFTKRQKREIVKAWQTSAWIARQTRRFTKLASVFSSSTVMRNAFNRWIQYHEQFQFFAQQRQKAAAHHNLVVFKTVGKKCLKEWGKLLKFVQSARDNAFLLGEKSNEDRLQFTFENWVRAVEELKHERELLKILR